MPVKNDNFVKRPREEHSYTPEEILEFQKCSEDGTHLNEISLFQNYRLLVCSPVLS